VKEVADSMKPGGWLHTSVIEVGIQSIRMNMPENNKKVIMPLRVAVSFQFSYYLFATLTLFFLFAFMLFFYYFYGFYFFPTDLDAGTELDWC
jgi:hypothetical protein